MKKIIITGTSRGIGYELALKFANAGYQVLAISRKTPRILIEHENISCISVDLSSESDLAKVENVLSKSWKTVDAIVHNAGSFLSKPFEEITQEDFENV
jgi:short-subunit dehydrogenase